MAGAGTATRTRRSVHDLLGIYLNDHLAGATGGLELARRVAASHRGPGAGAAVSVWPPRLRAGSCRAGGHHGRTRHPGPRLQGLRRVDRLEGRPAEAQRLSAHPVALSGLEELEMLRLGVEGKAAGWRTLRVLAETDKRLDPGRLDELIARARRQADLLEELRVRAAGRGHRPGTDSR